MTKYSLLISSRSKEDVRQAKQWYRGQNPALPKRFDNDLKATVEQLRLRPLTHAVRYKNVRIANLKIFPYAVHYVVENSAILVFAVFHSASNLENWMKRIP